AVYGNPAALPGPAGPARGPSGFGVSVSGARPDDLHGQVRDAVLFLDLHEDELRRLGSFAGVEVVALEFRVRWKGGVPRTESFPPELLWRAGALDITLQVSHDTDEWKES